MWHSELQIHVQTFSEAEFMQYNFVDVSGHALESSQRLLYIMYILYITNQLKNHFCIQCLQTSCSGGGGGGKIRSGGGYCE
jgi:hypothetical protein